MRHLKLMCYVLGCPEQDLNRRVEKYLDGDEKTVKCVRKREKVIYRLLEKEGIL